MIIRVRAVLSLLAFLSLDVSVQGFSIVKPSQHLAAIHQRSLKIKHQLNLKDDDDDEEEVDDDIDISDRDWRAFRAQLVMKDSAVIDEDDETTGPSSDGKSETIIDEDDLDGIGSLFTDDEVTPMNKDNFTPLEPSQWAYDAGKLIEQGAVILGGVEQEFGFGLRQQYFHKVVCLILDHDENFTKGIILNRPTDMLLLDENDERWRIWFGGDVQNLSHPMPDIVCMHTIPKGTNDLIDKTSKTVMKDIQWCSFRDAKLLVKKKVCKTSDFWCFAGYCGWGPGQLMGELERKSWYMCATDSQTLLKELQKQSAYTDPRDAGIDTWELLMNMIGRGDTAEECSGDFEDLMLKEWARNNLLSVEAGGNAGIRLQPSDVATTNMRLVQGETIDDFMKQTVSALKAGSVGVGSVLRASSADRSPFLLEDQEFHKSIILLIAEDDNTSVGLILNEPSSKGFEMELRDKKGQSKEVVLPVRFGGQYAIRGQAPLVWLHYSEALREAKCGSPVGKVSGIWQCSQTDATESISAGIAKPSDFLIVSGLSVWIKGERGVSDGLRGEVKKGRFEVVKESRIGKVWNALQTQTILTKMDFVKNLTNGINAWKVGGEDSNNEIEEEEPISGIGEGYDEEDDKLVFKSDVKVSKLSDDALKSWVATFLLGAPSLGA